MTWINFDWFQRDALVGIGSIIRRSRADRVSYRRFDFHAMSAWERSSFEEFAIAATMGSSIPASAASGQTLIIPSLFHEFFKRRSACACFLQLQLQPQRRQNIGDLGISQFAHLSVLQGIERGEPDLSFSCNRGLRQAEFFALDGDLLA